MKTAREKNTDRRGDSIGFVIAGSCHGPSVAGHSGRGFPASSRAQGKRDDKPKRRTPHTDLRSGGHKIQIGCLKAALYRLAAMEEKSEEEPDGLGEPFGEGEMTWEYGKELHQNEKKRDQYAESGDEAQVPGRFDEKEG
jgi:hypothetical protein